MTAPTLTDRVRTALLDLNRAKRFSQTKVARELGVNPSAISKMLNDDSRGITLRFVEAVAKSAGIPLAELVAEPGSAVKELNASENALLRALRLWPDTVTRALLSFVGFFADEPIAAGQARAMHEHWRHLSQTDRDLLEGYARFLRRKDVDRGLLERIAHQATADAEALTEPPTVGPGPKFQRPRRKP